MPPQPLSSRFDPLHDRLTVVTVAAGEQAAFAEYLAADLADDRAVDLRPISIVRYADIAAMAECLAAERAAARAAVLDQAKARLDAAAETLGRAAERHHALTARITRFEQDLVQCEGVAEHAEELYRLVAGAVDDAAARRKDVEAAQHRLDGVLQQRRAARAAVDAAGRELAIEGSESAHELWDQIGSVWAVLDDAETVARAELDDAAKASAAADHMCDRNARLLTSAAHRARALVDALPADLRPALGPRPLDGLAELAVALREIIRRQQPELAAVTAAAGRANEAVEAAAADVRAIQTTCDGPPSFVVMAEALGELITRQRGRWIVVEGAFDGLDTMMRDALLVAAVDASALQALIVLTDDTNVLSWAIDLPSEAGSATTTDALAAAGVIRPATEPEPDLDQPMPIDAAARGRLAG